MKKNILIVILLLGFSSSHLLAQSKKLSRALQAIEAQYVDPVSSDTLTELAIRAMLEKLDPHSLYIPAAQVAQMEEQLKDHFVGIGILAGQYNDTLTVYRILPNSPASQAGLQVGDQILSVNQQTVSGIGRSRSDAFTFLKGNEGTRMDLRIRRPVHEQVSTYSLVRQPVPNPSVDAAYLLDSVTGCIHVAIFSKHTVHEFIEAVRELQAQGMTQLVLDLRNNGGGLLEEGIGLANQFLPEGTLITSTRGAHSKPKEFKARSGGIFLKGRVVVLINEGTASASEVCAGALQDWKRALIIGRRSFGKGLVQNPILLPDRSIIRLTTARYYTPLGKCIQKPYSDYPNDLEHRIAHHELVNADSMSHDGGIIPDRFVPLDTSAYSPYCLALLNSDLVNHAVIGYYLQNHQQLTQQYPNADAFLTHFEFPPALFNEVKEQAALNKTLPSPPNDEQKLKFVVYLQMKAQIAEYLWGQEALQKAINVNSKEIQAALECLYKP